MLQPKRTKYRKVHKGRNDGLAWSGNAVSFGEYGLKSTAHGPGQPTTKKPIEVRMGTGKGNVEYWVAQIQPGRMIYEIEGVAETVAREAFRLAAAKLSVTTTFVTRTVR